MRNLFSKTVLIAAGLIAAAPAVATDFDAIAITVATQDLDLANPSDVARLDARLARAAGAVCMSGDMGGIAGRRAFETCKADALEAARAQRLARR